MQMRASLLLAAALAASPAWSADAAKREAERPSTPQFGTASAKAAISATGATAPRKPKRVRYTIPAPTRM